MLCAIATTRAFFANRPVCMLVFAACFYAVSGWSAEADTPWGHPNLTGVWDFRSATPLEAPQNINNGTDFTEAQASRFTQAAEDWWRDRTYDEPWADRGRQLSEGRRSSLIVAPNDGRLPSRTARGATYQGAWRQAMGAPLTAHPEDRTVLERCIVSSSIPLQNTNFNNNLQIFQTPTHVVLLTEMVHEARIVTLNGSNANVPPNWLGTSTGRWDDTTLVVTTSGFREYTNRIGTSADMTIIERLTKTDANTLSYEYTIEDAGAFTSSWTARQTLRRATGKIYEYACHEGNESLAAMLRGARVVEGEARVVEEDDFK